jgi:hypothetical protein
MHIIDRYRYNILVSGIIYYNSRIDELLLLLPTRLNIRATCIIRGWINSRAVVKRDT